MLNTQMAKLRDTEGFTLIELLIVVVIIGILAAIAIPQFSSTKEKAYDAAAKSDLRNLMTAEEGHFATYGQYANNITTSSPSSDQVQFDGTQNVTIQVATSGKGYVAEASHTQSGQVYCVNVNQGGTDDGEVQLDDGGSLDGSCT